MSKPPVNPWRFNPHTGEKRDDVDVVADPYGIFINRSDPRNIPHKKPCGPALGHKQSQVHLKISTEEFQTICDMTVRLTEIRQRGCAHLHVENLAPEIMRKLMNELARFKAMKSAMPEGDE